MRQEVIDISWQFERIVHKYTMYEKKPRRYGIDTPLTQTEIHAVAAIDERPGMNLNALAQDKGVTKGAASQLVARLVKKGLVKKAASPGSASEIALFLTDKGAVAARAHEQEHKDMGHAFDKNVLSQMSDEDLARVSQLFAKFEEMMDKALAED